MAPLYLDVTVPRYRVALVFSYRMLPIAIFGVRYTARLAPSGDLRAYPTSDRKNESARGEEESEAEEGGEEEKRSYAVGRRARTPYYMRPGFISISRAGAVRRKSEI